MDDPLLPYPFLIGLPGFSGLWATGNLVGAAARSGGFFGLHRQDHESGGVAAPRKHQVRQGIESSEPAHAVPAGKAPDDSREK